MTGGRRKSERPSSAPLAERGLHGGFFGPADRPLFGVLHRPPPGVPASGMGVVICNPFGYEAVCAHRSLRHFARIAASLGCPALHFDYDGTGDSAGDDADPDRLGAWVKSIGAAIDELVRTTGVRRVVLLGVRFGALLASLAATGREDVDGIVAIAPVVSGRLYLRELKALHHAIGLPPAPPGVATAPLGEESAGFWISPETLAAVGALDAVKAGGATTAHMLVIDRHDLPGSDKWIARLRDGGVEVETERAPGYQEMMLDPHATRIPTRMVELFSTWLSTRRDLAPRPVVALNEPIPPSAQWNGIEERAVSIDGDFVVGVESSPSAGARSGRAIVLLNAGAVRHIGPNRLYVGLARRWAAMGHVVLRLDISGIGESAPRGRSPDHDVYSPHAVPDIDLAVRYLQAQPGVTHVDAIGLCSGAYHAYKAAAKGVPLDGIVPINPLVFFYRKGGSLDVPIHQTTRHTKYYKTSALDPDKWRKLVRGEVNLAVLGKTVFNQARSIARFRLKDWARSAGVPYPEDLGFDLETLAGRGVRMHFLFAEGEAGFDLLRLEGGSAVPRLLASKELVVEFVEGPDHTFTQVWSHPVLVARLGAVLDGPPSRRKALSRPPGRRARLRS